MRLDRYNVTVQTPRSRVFRKQVGDRSRELEADGRSQLKKISTQEVDLHGLAGLVADEKCSLDWRRRALTLCWGTYPTGKWLERHGWACAGECPVCGAALATPGGTDPEVCDDARCAGAGAGARAHTDGRTPTGAMMSRRKAGDAKCRHSQRGPDWGRGGDR